MYQVCTFVDNEFTIIVASIPSHSVADAVRRGISETYNDPNVYIVSE